MPEEIRVRQGDCISSIADRTGHFPDTIWDHADNAELKELRGDPNVLEPRDTVVVPDIEPRTESRASQERHRFRRLGVPARLRIRFLVNDEPRANESYQICIDGEWDEGTLDGDGLMDRPLPPQAREGVIVFGEGDSQDRYEIRFGSIDPIDSEEGVRGRLEDLGYPARRSQRRAVRSFQEREGLEPTGRLDDETRQKLQEKFGI